MITSLNANRFCWSFLPPLLFAYLLSAPCVGEDERAPPERTVVFPDKAIGVLKTRDWNPEKGFYPHFDGDYIGEACGQISVAQGIELCLIFYADLKDPSPLAHLKANDIQSLDFQGAELADADLRHIGHLTGLTFLDLADTPISSQGLEHIENLVSLKWLWLTRTRVDDSGLIHLRKMTNLRKLGLQDMRVTDEGLRYLPALSGLEELFLDHNRITGSGFYHLSALPKLFHLCADETQISDEALAHIGKIPALSSLRLDDTCLTDRTLLNMADADSLQHLTLDNLRGESLHITDAGLRHLTKLKSLESVSLSGANITDEGLALLREADKLRGLGLDHTRITDKGLARLVEMGRVEWLSIRGTKTTDEGLHHLESLPTLRYVDLTGTRTTEDGVEAFKRRRPECELAEPDWSYYHRSPAALSVEKLLQAPPGTEMSWEALRGSVVVLEFWATYCAPCREQMEHLNDAAESFKGRPLRIIWITREDESIVMPFLKKQLVRGWIGLDTDRSVYAAFKVEWIPHTVIVDKNGLVVFTGDYNRVTVPMLRNLLDE